MITQLLWSAENATHTEPPDVGLVQRVHLHESIARCVIEPSDNCGVGAGRKGSNYGRLKIALGCQTGGDNGQILGVLPIIVRGNQRAVTVVDLQDRIRHNRGYIEGGLTQRGTERTDDHSLILGLHDYSRDHDVVSSLDETPGRDVAELRATAAYVVDFYQRDACAVVI